MGYSSAVLRICPWRLGCVCDKTLPYPGISPIPQNQNEQRKKNQQTKAHPPCFPDDVGIRQHPERCSGEPPNYLQWPNEWQESAERPWISPKWRCFGVEHVLRVVGEEQVAHDDLYDPQRHRDAKQPRMKGRRVQERRKFGSDSGI